MSHRVLILYNEPVLPLDHPDAESEREILFTLDGVRDRLVEAGFDVRPFGLGRQPGDLLDALREHQPDVVFNLFEGSADHGHTEAYVAGLLDWLHVPFTGSPFQTLCLARNKHMTKQMLHGAGLPTPRGVVVHQPPVPPWTLSWPVFVKPATEDGSVGIDQGSVIADQRALEARVALLLERYDPPVLVEEYIPGREVIVAITETPHVRFLPITELLLQNLVAHDARYWPINTYQTKWASGTDEFEKTDLVYGADLPPETADRLRSLALQAFRLLECRDYARVDFRLRPDGEPFILEVNPNPDISPVAGLANSLEAAGESHGQFVVSLVHAALARGRQRPASRARAASLGGALAG